MSTDDAPNMVGAMRGEHYMPQMSVFGYVIAGLMLPILLPLLPFVALYLAYDRVATAITG